MKQVSVEMAF